MDDVPRRRRLSAPQALTIDDAQTTGALRVRLLLEASKMPFHFTSGDLREIEANIMASGRAQGYQPACFPKNEEKRLEALHSLEMTPEKEDAFDHVVLLARDLFDCPISVISFVDLTSQWVKAEVGLESGGPFPRVSSICAHSLHNPEDVLVVSDLTLDERFAKNPLVRGSPFWAFYAGAPLVTADGLPVGTLCVIDHKPRSGFTSKELTRLKLLAHQVMNEVQLRKALSESLALKGRMNDLLENVFPLQISERLLIEPSIHDSVECTVCFVDLVGFTSWTSHQKQVAKVVALLDSLFCAFDSVTVQTGVCKIKTIGDGYLFAAGVPTFVPDHAVRAVETALIFFTLMQNVNKMHATSFDLRIGMASGMAVAGVVGNIRFAYDLWGETVNIASRVESNAQPGKVTLAPSTYELLKGDRRFQIAPMDHVTLVKGIGEMQLFVLDRAM